MRAVTVLALCIFFNLALIGTACWILKEFDTAHGFWLVLLMHMPKSAN